MLTVTATHHYLLHLYTATSTPSRHYLRFVSFPHNPPIVLCFQKQRELSFLGHGTWGCLPQAGASTNRSYSLPELATSTSPPFPTSRQLPRQCRVAELAVICAETPVKRRRLLRLLLTRCCEVEDRQEDYDLCAAIATAQPNTQPNEEGTAYRDAVSQVRQSYNMPHAAQLASYLRLANEMDAGDDTSTTVDETDSSSPGPGGSYHFTLHSVVQISGLQKSPQHNTRVGCYGKSQDWAPLDWSGYILTTNVLD